MRKRSPEPEENSERWLVSYADFITLMFAFFTIMYATSEQNTEKTKQFENSIRQYLIKFGAMGDSGNQINQGVEQNSPIEQTLLPFKKGSGEIKTEKKKIENYLQAKLSATEVEKLIKDIDSGTYGVKISLSADDLFDKESAQMKASALPILDEISRAIKSVNRQIIVEGHTDQKASENYPTAWELSSMQATKVLRYMTKVHNLDPGKIVSMSFGNQRPIPNYNRRIDILILAEDLPF